MRPIAFIMACLAVAALGLFAAAAGTAQAKEWWPVRVYDLGPMTPDEFDKASDLPAPVDYVPLDKASKKWHICVLFPHMKDSYWVAVNYGTVEEVERLGLKMSLFEAGGYTQLVRQIAQFEDCLALGVDAILIGVISEAGMKRKIEEARDKGVIVVGYANSIFDAPVHALVAYSNKVQCGVAAEHLVELFKDREEALIISLPGPQGSGWAEKCDERGLKPTIAGTNVKLLETKYGDTGKSVQLKMVEDALQTYDKIDAIFGVGVAASVAVPALEEAGRTDETKVMAWHISADMFHLLKRGDIEATVTHYPVDMARVAVDETVRILEGKPYMKTVFMEPAVVSHDTLDTFKRDGALAPDDWRSVYTVD